MPDVIIPKPGGSYNTSGPVPGSDDKLYVLNALGVWVLMSEQDTSLNSSETEADKLAAEAAQLAAETAETNAETAETNAELAETNAETAETNAETAETNAELAETNAETAETNAETAQGLAETAQGLAETAKTGAETAQGLAETAQGLAETAKTGAETAQGLAETAKTGAETAQGLAETAQAGAETAQGLAETAQGAAEAAALSIGLTKSDNNILPLKSATITTYTENEAHDNGGSATITAINPVNTDATITVKLFKDGSEMIDFRSVTGVNFSLLTKHEVADLISDKINLLTGTTDITASVGIDPSAVITGVWTGSHAAYIGAIIVLGCADLTYMATNWVDAAVATTVITIDNATADQKAYDYSALIGVDGKDWGATDAVKEVVGDTITLTILPENVFGAGTPAPADTLAAAYNAFDYAHNLNAYEVIFYAFTRSSMTSGVIRRNTLLEKEVWDGIIMQDLNNMSGSALNNKFYSAKMYAFKVNS